LIGEERCIRGYGFLVVVFLVVVAVLVEVAVDVAVIVELAVVVLVVASGSSSGAVIAGTVGDGCRALIF
jgi:hypothetical protein